MIDPNPPYGPEREALLIKLACAYESDLPCSQWDRTFGPLKGELPTAEYLLEHADDLLDPQDF